MKNTPTETTTTPAPNPEVIETKEAYDQSYRDYLEARQTAEQELNVPLTGRAFLLGISFLAAAIKRCAGQDVCQDADRGIADDANLIFEEMLQSHDGDDLCNRRYEYETARDAFLEAARKRNQKRSTGSGRMAGIVSIDSYWLLGLVVGDDVAAGLGQPGRLLEARSASGKEPNPDEASP